MLHVCLLVWFRPLVIGIKRYILVFSLHLSNIEWFQSLIPSEGISTLNIWRYLYLLHLLKLRLWRMQLNVCVCFNEALWRDVKLTLVASNPKTHRDAGRCFCTASPGLRFGKIDKIKIDWMSDTGVMHAYRNLSEFLFILAYLWLVWLCCVVTGKVLAYVCCTGF